MENNQAQRSDDDEDRLLSTPQAQRLLGVSNTKWYETIVTDPDFPAPIVIGCQHKRWKSELRAYAERRRVKREPANAV